MAAKTRRKSAPSAARPRRRSGGDGGRRRPGLHAKALPERAFPRLLRSLKPEIDSRLAAAFDAELRARSSLGPEVERILLEAKALSLRGGKRLRAGLVVAGQRALAKPTGRAWTKRQWDLALGAAVAVELLQSYFLIPFF